jgi:hypothetical protein
VKNAGLDLLWQAAGWHILREIGERGSRGGNAYDRSRQCTGECALEHVDLLCMFDIMICASKQQAVLWVPEGAHWPGARRFRGPSKP